MRKRVPHFASATWIAIAALAVALAAQPAVAAPAAEGSTTSAGVASCASPPDSADATVANRDRFIELWLPRLKDQDWLDGWVDLSTVPDDIVAEGFHGMDEATQGWLTACLTAEVYARAGQASSREEELEVQAGLHLMIFGKAQLADMRRQLTQVSEPQSSPEPVPEDLTAGALATMADELASLPSLTAASHATFEASATVPKQKPTPPDPKVHEALEPAMPVVQGLLNGVDNVRRLHR